MKKLLLATFTILFFQLPALALQNNLLIKGRGGMLQLGLSTKNPTPDSEKLKFKDGWIGEAALDYLLTKNIAFEVSAGYGLFDSKSHGKRR